MPAPTESEMMADLAHADASGDHELAQHIAGQIRAQRGPAAAQSEPISTPLAALGGLSQGAGMGFADEATAGWHSLFPGGKPYKEGLKDERAWHDSARKQHPLAYGASEVGGSMLPSAVLAAATGGTSMAPMLAKAALPMVAGQGALQGAGYSNADTARGVAGDSALGAGVGLAGYGLGQGLRALGGAAAGSARGLVARAESKAADKAAQEVAEGIASAKGSLGGEVQKGQRLVENLRRLGPDLTAEEKAAVDQLEQRLTASTREALPGQVSTIAAKDAELAAAKSGASEAFNSRKADLLSTGEMKHQVLARALRYGPVAVGSLAGHAIGGPVGGVVGALAGAGTRPMVQSVLRMSKNPAVQKAVGDFISDTAQGPTATFLRKAIAAGLPAEAIPQLVNH